ncbi:MAG: formyltransferase family protein [Balneolaceae bacterium]
MNILLIAEESAGIQTFRLLADSNHTLKGVFADTSKKGASVAAVAQKNGYDVQSPNLVKDPAFADWIIKNHIDLLLNVHSLFVICPQVIDAVNFGAFNLHPGPLPKYAGLNAPSWAIYNQEKEHGVTLHQITKSIDTGDIIDEARFPISKTDTGLSLSAKCVKHGLLLIKRLLNNVQTHPDSLTRTKQDLTLRTCYSGKQIPNQGRIQWDSPAEKIDAFVRACNYSPFQSPWGHPKTKNKESEFSILKTEISGQPCDKTPGTIGEPIHKKTAIATADFWLLISRCLVNGNHVDANTVLHPGDLLT